MILPESKQIAKEYPLSEEEINDYLLTGLRPEWVRMVCDARLEANMSHWQTLEMIRAGMAYLDLKGV